jgi:hypothetical protein
MPGMADKFAQSAQGRLPWLGMTNSLQSADSIGCIFGHPLRIEAEEQNPSGRIHNQQSGRRTCAHSTRYLEYRLTGAVIRMIQIE